MKHMRKVFALALTLIMALALTVPAFAAEGDKTITVSNAVDGQTYTAYQVFGVTNSGGNYAYTITSDSAFYDTVTAYAAAHRGESFVLTQVGSSTTYTVVADVDANNQILLNAADFAAALSADTTKGTAAGSAVAASGTAVINVAGAGYYFLDSSLGSLCALDTAVDSVTVYEKNSLPTLAKTVYEDSTQAYGDTATADIGQVVNFKLTVNTGTNAYAPAGNPKDEGVDANYVITDTLPAGMSYVESSAAITGWTVGTDFTVDYSGDVLTITLKESKVSTLGQSADIVITYNAKMDTDAVVGTAGNTNTATLAYNGYETEEVDATVYTYGVNFLKYTLGEDDSNVPLADAVFSLSKNNDGSNALTFTAVEVEEGATPVYRYESGVTGSVTTITTDAKGAFIIQGLDADTYYLTETEAPAGYNKLTAPVVIVIDEVGNVTQDGVAATTVSVLNRTGAELPSTGGIGTTIFYMVGGILMAGAAILLITKKKMSNEQ